MQHRFTLQKYAGTNTRYTCPGCGAKKQFTRYIDTNSGAQLADNVGICNRINNCGYHYTPREFFRDNAHKKSQYFNKTTCNNMNTSGIKQTTACIDKKQQPAILSIKDKHFDDSREDPFNNPLFTYIYNTFGLDKSNSLYNTYYIGSCIHKNKNATIFWQIDHKQNIRAGKVIHYNSETGKREKNMHTTWVHSIHPYYRKKKYTIQQCLFGEHLLNEYPEKPIGVVESEKTAIIASGYVPEYLWLATGSLHEFKWSKLRILNGHKVIAFPDLGGYNYWCQKLRSLKFRIHVSYILEEMATTEERQSGLDIGDYFRKRMSRVVNGE